MYHSTISTVYEWKLLTHSKSIYTKGNWYLLNISKWNEFKESTQWLLPLLMTLCVWFIMVIIGYFSALVYEKSHDLTLSLVVLIFGLYMWNKLRNLSNRCGDF